MPEDIHRRLDMVERNQTDHAKTLTEVIGGLRETRDEVADLKLANAVNAEREKARDDWRGRTEAKLDNIYKLGWWVLTTFGVLTMSALANLLYSGGPNGP